MLFRIGIKIKFMSNQSKVYISTIVTWMLSVKLFLLVSFYQEFGTIFKYSNNFLDFISQGLIFLHDFVLIAHNSTIIFSTVFAALLFYFYYTYFYIYFSKVDRQYRPGKNKHAIIGTVFTFLGFGCIACGQTLLYSFLLLLGSSVSAALAPIIGEISLIIGILFLSFGIYENRKIINSPNICKI